MADFIQIMPDMLENLTLGQAQEVEDLAHQLSLILEGVADPALAKPILSWIISNSGTRAKSSLVAFLGDLRVMAPLFRANRLMLVPARPAALGQYIDKIATDLIPVKPSTIARRMASIALLHKAAGLPVPTRSQTVRDALARHKRAKGTVVRQATPLRTADVKKMLTLIGTDLTDLRDRALILVAHDTGLRASELLGLQIEHIERLGHGRGQIFFHPPRSEASSPGISITISNAAISAIESWIAAAGLTQGPLFRGFDTAGNLRETALSRQSYDRIIKYRAAMIGLGQGISAHSSRVGFAQDLLEKGASHLAVMKAGRWKSVGMVLHYGEQIAPDTSVAVERFLDE
jgi:integrase